MTRDPAVPRILIGGTPVDRYTEHDLLEMIRDRVASGDNRALSVVSVNLDHLHHFERRGNVIGATDAPFDWVMVADGAPIAWRGGSLSKQPWPRVTGADLLPEIVSMCEREKITIGFLGGLPDVHDNLTIEFAERYPALQVAGFWAPQRAVIEDAEQSAALAREIRQTGVEVLVVGLGKPRQELWIEEFGAGTGAKVLLPFGASADFLAGAVDRAPKMLRNNGFEWLFRLWQEPRRLARRYLVQGPFALAHLKRAVMVDSEPPTTPTSTAEQAPRP
ncbi:WecB/TagA/CpsF family glycosyltransferase [Antrihabitans sp. YC3-6]|uniref:WecB/TagA/CpsF family glycosyltransferase n=1 Tax=Antrihabitans stalagmiti TaxID=2799499 RepID=A0A934U4I6_9NOCA|nr:WecB/TagA/CpsF family glycosyltransferase [Antrihabitans stalagmiti]MBJ8340471.1 WecB/TagA/CpsF family glycosyltransferase [Antrihabitans stalagmiti]